MKNIDEIKTIVELMSEHDLTEFKIEADEMHLCIRRGSDQPVQMVQAPQMQAMAPMAAPAAAPTADEAPAAAAEVAGETIDSPIVGTFYEASSPDSPAFAQVGDKVSPDTVVCIVEAMKVMNEIKAEKSGVIKEVLVDNAQPVEYGQPLFVIG